MFTGFLILVVAAMTFSIVAFAWKLRVFTRLPRPVDRALPKGSIASGVLYAYTLGMAPWSKESTRRHWVAYMRGIAFHVGIFLGLALLVASPWLGSIPFLWKALLGAVLGAAAFLGLAGFALRFMDGNLQNLSAPDDYFAVLAVSLFLGSGALWLAGWLSVEVFYAVSAAMLVYAPFGKIRHCIYFAFSRLFYGRFVGTRAVLPHAQQEAR